MHLLLSAPFEAYQALTSTPLPAPHRYGSLSNFLAFVGTHYIPLFNSLENVLTITHAALTHLVADQVIYAEASLPLTLPRKLGISWSAFAAAIQQAVAQFTSHLTIRLEIGHAREVTFDWRPELQRAIDSGLFAGVDLYGDETHGDISEFADYFAAARHHGMYTKLHCGEGTDAARMRYDVTQVNPDQIQHGIAAIRDPELLALLRDRAIPLNVCPASNIYTGIVAAYDSHPIHTLADAGIRTRLATDDFALFGTSLSQEYQLLLEHDTLSHTQLNCMRIDGLST